MSRPLVQHTGRASCRRVHFRENDLEATTRRGSNRGMTVFCILVKSSGPRFKNTEEFQTLRNKGQLLTEPRDYLERLLFRPVRNTDKFKEVPKIDGSALSKKGPEAVRIPRTRVCHANSKPQCQGITERDRTKRDLSERKVAKDLARQAPSHLSVSPSTRSRSCPPPTARTRSPG